MQNFQDISKTCKRSFISAFSIWMTVPSKGCLFSQKNKNKQQINKTKKEKKIYHSCLTEFNTKHFSGRAKQKQLIWIKSKSEWNFTLNVNDTTADRIYISEVNSIREEKLMKKERPVKNYISFLFRKFSKKS